MAQSPEQLICDAVSILASVEIMDYNGHASLRGREGGFYINTADSDRAAMTPDQVCFVNHEGNSISGERPPNEVALHAAIFSARPDIQAIVHGHPKWSTLYTLTEQEIPTVMPQGCLVANLPVYPKSHSISKPERGAAVAEVIGQSDGALLAGHGSVLAGQTIQQAVALAIYTEQNAERAYRSKTLGQAKTISGPEQEEYRTGLAKPALYQKCWSFYLGQGKAK